MELLPLKVEHGEVRHGGKTLVGPVDMTLAGEGTTIVIGPNGSGKTTLLRMLHGLARLSSGQLRWACPMAQARQRQAFVFQSPVMMRRSVRDNLAYALTTMGVPRRDARKRAGEWAMRVGLGDALERRATVLSGGECQKLAIARALIREPDILFLDEPCASLDGSATRDIEAILNEARATGTRLIMATHDMGQARRMADEVVFMLHGKVHEFTPSPEFFDRPRTARAAAFARGDIVV